MTETYDSIVEGQWCATNSIERELLKLFDGTSMTQGKLNDKNLGLKKNAL